ncbi:copper chaperone PCu(A)C [Microbacterium sp. VKM Ac-2870]|uniref:copper chaperone PCu(A)C n=1 Tax=Microbacterium sp. VKM Ac-2870 TaxID=2783825 RepID=UPI002B264F58|nr:copper chaperone PCu(A)C [Microbacterium sp. VKM Ac-2870]
MSTHTSSPYRRLLSTARIGALIAAGLLALSGCASTAAPAASTTSAAAGASVTISDAWVKAADSGMSAAFGTLHNSSSADVTLTAATSPASSMLQLHETVADASGAMVMKEKAGGFVIPAGGDLVLQPGGNHIMLMDLTAPLKAGAETTFTLTFSDGSATQFTAPVKDYSGANENYQGGGMQMSPSPAPSH